MQDLVRDFGLMQEMFFGQSPPFSAILEQLRVLENKINSREA
jgi:hypothetical protein